MADFFYPPLCAGCGITNGSHRALCPDCWSTVRFIERPFCDCLGIPFAFDHGPGALSVDAIANPPDFHRLRSVALHEGVVKLLVHGLKYRDRTDLAPMMADWMHRAGAVELGSAQVVLPVPLHRSRLFSRRFNQSAELARLIASKSEDVRYLPRALLRVKPTARQVGLGRNARLENVRGAFKVTPEGREGLVGKRVILVDDVYTTGATVNAAARALRRAGVLDVTVLTFAMALPGPI